MSGLSNVCALFVTTMVICLLAPVAEAELRNPYVVEDNSPQWFGDSATVDGHFGLENYSSGYVNGYLNLRFLTTHNQCCYASSAPSLFVTKSDPRLGYASADILLGTDTEVPFGGSSR